MEHISGFLQSPSFPPSGKCPCHIAPGVAMVIDIGVNNKTKHTSGMVHAYVDQKLV
jgi:hypothetical protein